MSFLPSSGERVQTNIANEFLKSILKKDYEVLTSVTDDSHESEKCAPGMSVLRDVVDLETGQRRDIEIRNLTPDYWQVCMDTANV